MSPTFRSCARTRTRSSISSKAKWSRSSTRSKESSSWATPSLPMSLPGWPMSGTKPPRGTCKLASTIRIRPKVITHTETSWTQPRSRRAWNHTVRNRECNFDPKSRPWSTRAWTPRKKTSRNMASDKCFRQGVSRSNNLEKWKSNRRNLRTKRCWWRCKNRIHWKVPTITITHLTAQLLPAMRSSSRGIWIIQSTLSLSLRKIMLRLKIRERKIRCGMTTTAWLGMSWVKQTWNMLEAPLYWIKKSTLLRNKIIDFWKTFKSTENKFNKNKRLVLWRNGICFRLKTRCSKPNITKQPCNPLWIRYISSKTPANLFLGNNKPKCCQHRRDRASLKIKNTDPIWLWNSITLPRDVTCQCFQKKPWEIHCKILSIATTTTNLRNNNSSTLGSLGPPSRSTFKTSIRNSKWRGCNRKSSCHPQGMSGPVISGVRSRVAAAGSRVLTRKAWYLSCRVTKMSRV